MNETALCPVSCRHGRRTAAPSERGLGGTQALGGRPGLGMQDWPPIQPPLAAQVCGRLSPQRRDHGKTRRSPNPRLSALGNSQARGARSAHGQLAPSWLDPDKPSHGRLGFKQSHAHTHLTPQYRGARGGDMQISLETFPRFAAATIGTELRLSVCL